MTTGPHRAQLFSRDRLPGPTAIVTAGESSFGRVLCVLCLVLVWCVVARRGVRLITTTLQVDYVFMKGPKCLPMFYRPGKRCVNVVSDQRSFDILTYLHLYITGSDASALQSAAEVGSCMTPVGPHIKRTVRS